MRLDNLKRMIMLPSMLEQLISLAQRGDKKAFQQVIESHRGLVFFFVNWWRRKYPEHLEDLEQEAFLGLTLAIQNYLPGNSKGGFSPYAGVYIKRRLFNYVKSLKKNERLGAMAIPTIANMGIFEDLDKLNKALDILDERERDIINECFLGETPIRGRAGPMQALGDKYGLSRERIRQLKNSALEKLRDYLTKPGEEVT